MNIGKKLLSIALCLILLFGTLAVGTGGFFDMLEAMSIKASAAYSVGDTIYYGTYPQTDVTASLGSVLDSQSGTWKSYGYYSGTGNIDDGQMTASDYMRYKDVTYNGAKYRGVTFDTYRPYYTGYQTSTSASTYQDDNGYTYGNVYWFKYEPLEWRVLDLSTGLVMCETIIDSQPYNNYIISSGTDSHGYTALWGNSSKTYYANDYAKSSIRQWLNNDFFNTAFSDEQKLNIKTTTLNNDGFFTLKGKTGYEDYDSASTNDKIFLLSYDEMLNSSYGFSTSYSTNDSARLAKGSDYAKCQGLYVYKSSNSSYDGCSYWRLRSPGYDSGHTFHVNVNAAVDIGGYLTNSAHSGVRPALKLQNLKFDYAESKFDESCRYWFYNGYEHFYTDWSGGTYYMTDSDTEKLFAYIEKYDADPDYSISRVQNMMSDEWGGSCYGMATTSVLDYRNKIAFNENFDTNAPTMHDVKSPSQSPEIMSAINYYMLSQCIGFIEDNSKYYDYFDSSWSDGLRELVATARKGEPFLFSYYGMEIMYGFIFTYGHAIVALDMTENDDGSYSIRAYDNRYPDDDVYIVIDLGGVHLETPDGTESIIGIEFDDDMSAFDLIDIDGPNNDMNIVSASYTHTNANARIQIVADGDVTIKNNAGETIKISEGKISGSMNIISKHIIVRDTADGQPAPVTFVLEVPNSNSFTVMSTSASIDAAITTANMYAAASAGNANSVVFNDSKGVYVYGDEIEYKTAISSKDSGYNTLIVEGSSGADVSLTYSGSDIVIGGETSSDKSITVFTNNADYENYSVPEGYSNIVLTTDRTDNIDIKASSKNDGNYDISLIAQEEPANPTASAKLNAKSSTTVDYRSKVNITATASGVPDGYFLAIYSGNTLLEKGTKDKVTYTPKDSNGKPLELKSDTTYTVKAIDGKNAVQKDSNGKDLTANVEIKVKQGFFDKLIAFFKGLFGLLPTVEIKP